MLNKIQHIIVYEYYGSSSIKRILKCDNRVININWLKFDSKKEAEDWFYSQSEETMSLKSSTEINKEIIPDCERGIFSQPFPFMPFKGIRCRKCNGKIKV